MSQDIQLVAKGDITKLVRELLEKEKLFVRDARKILPILQDEGTKKSLQNKILASLEVIGALECGFLPVPNAWGWNTDTKAKWQKKQVADIIDTMPVEVKEAWQRVKKLDIFKGYAVSGARRGDPMLYGKAGRKYFLIATWINFDNDLAIGFIARSK